MLTFVECLDQRLSVRPSRVIINVQRDAEFRSHLCACAHGSSLNRFWLVSGQSESASHNHQTRNQQTAKGKLVTSWSRVLDLRHSLPPSSTYFSSVHISVRSPISLFNLTPSWLMRNRHSARADNLITLRQVCSFS